MAPDSPSHDPPPVASSGHSPRNEEEALGALLSCDPGALVLHCWDGLQQNPPIPSSWRTSSLRGLPCTEQTCFGLSSPIFGPRPPLIPAIICGMNIIGINGLPVGILPILWAGNSPVVLHWWDGLQQSPPVPSSWRTSSLRVLPCTEQTCLGLSSSFFGPRAPPIPPIMGGMNIIANGLPPAKPKSPILLFFLSGSSP